MMLNKEIRSARLLYTRPQTSKVSCSFFYYNGVTTAEGLCYLSEVSLVIEVQYLELYFHELEFFFLKIVKNIYLMFNTQLLYQQEAYFIL